MRRRTALILAALAFALTFAVQAVGGGGSGAQPEAASAPRVTVNEAGPEIDVTLAGARTVPALRNPRRPPKPRPQKRKPAAPAPKITRPPSTVPATPTPAPTAAPRFVPTPAPTPRYVPPVRPRSTPTPRPAPTTPPESSGEFDSTGDSDSSGSP